MCLIKKKEREGKRKREFCGRVNIIDNININIIVLFICEKLLELVIHVYYSF